MTNSNQLNAPGEKEPSGTERNKFPGGHESENKKAPGIPYSKRIAVPSSGASKLDSLVENGTYLILEKIAI